MGPMALGRRAYDHCSACRKGPCPADAGFGLGPSAKGLSDRECHTRKHEGGPAILAVLEALGRGGRSESAIEVHRQVTQSVGDHKDRTDYPSDRASGWPIGSGHIEAACKTVVDERLKRSAMRWAGDGADAVCHLRALFKGDVEPWEASWAPAING